MNDDLHALEEDTFEGDDEGEPVEAETSGSAPALRAASGWVARNSSSSSCSALRTARP